MLWPQIRKYILRVNVQFKILGVIVTFTTAQPWGMKAVVSCMLLLSPIKIAQDKESHITVALTVLSCAVLVSSVLPACLFSVHSRKRTNDFCLQAVLMHFSICVLSFIVNNPLTTNFFFKDLQQTHIHAALVHALYCEARHLNTHRRTLPYASVTAVAMRALYVISCLVFAVCSKPMLINMSNFNLMLVFFGGEVLGLIINSLVRVIDTIANAYSNLFEET